MELSQKILGLGEKAINLVTCIKFEHKLVQVSNNSKLEGATRKQSPWLSGDRWQHLQKSGAEENGAVESQLF